MTRKMLLLMALAVFCIGTAYAGPPIFKMPFPAGESWSVSQGNSSCSTCTHKASGKETYAWDFNFGSTSDSDLCKPVFASATGTVTFAGRAKEMENGQRTKNSNFGNVVMIKYDDNDNINDYYGEFAHLLDGETDVAGTLKDCSMPVSVGQKVSQGEVVGYVGGTGFTDDHWSPHLHYQVQVVADGATDTTYGYYFVYEASGQTTFSDPDVLLKDPDGIPKQGKEYTSGNYFTHFNFNDSTSQGWTAGNDAKDPNLNSPILTTGGDSILPSNQTGTSSLKYWEVVVDDFDLNGVMNPGVVSPEFTNVTTGKFPRLRFRANTEKEF